ncbi:MAG: hypothetical protein ACE5EO_04185 [Candidatus Krumholzibacteriia bacterium]
MAFRRAGAGCLAFALVLLASCAAGRNRSTGVSRPGPAHPAVVGPATGSEDSLAVVDEALAELEESDALESAPPAIPAAATRRDGGTGRIRAGRTGRPVAEWQVIGGWRSQHEARVQLPAGVSVGFKSRKYSTVGFLNYRGRGFIESFHAGNLAVHMGERLLLGRRGGRFPPATWGPVGGGVRVSPSLSTWFGQNGIVVGTQWHGWRSRGILVGNDDAPLSSLWVTLGRSGREQHVGVALGRRLRGDGLPPGISQPGAVALYGSVRRRVLAASGEVVRLANGDLFAAVRVTRFREGKWTLLVYRAPTFSSTVQPAVDFLPTESIRRGARLDARSRLGAGTVLISVRVGNVGTPERSRRFRRAVVELAGKRGRLLSWKSGADWTMQRRLARTGDVFPLPSERRRLSGRVRGALRLRDGSTVHDLRVEYVPPVAGRGAGLVLAVAGSAELGRLSAAWRITAYSLPPGQLSFLTRPGAGPFEVFSTVAGKGSDVATRLRLRIAPGLRLFLYYGVPNLKEQRTYLGMHLRV